MKLAVALCGLSLAVLAVLAVQALRQELNIREFRTRLTLDAADFKRKDATLTEMKSKVEALKTSLTSAKTKLNELNAVKQATRKASEDLEAQIKTCEAEKEQNLAGKSQLELSQAESRSGHAADKMKFEEEIKALKAQILERDQAICAFVDETKPEGLQLCGRS